MTPVPPQHALKTPRRLLCPGAHQIMYSTIKGDVCMEAAYSNELPGFGCKVRVHTLLGSAQPARSEEDAARGAKHAFSRFKKFTFLLFRLASPTTPPATPPAS